MYQILKKIATTGIVTEAPPPLDAAVRAEVGRINDELLAILGQALAIRQVDAGSCNGCELEIHALTNPYYNIEGLGIRFVASPRHADMLLVTGPLTLNMREALYRTYAATPAPKWVVAVGDCAINGGAFAGSYAVANGIGEAVPVDLTIAGCPPEPEQLLSGLLTLLEASSRAPPAV